MQEVTTIDPTATSYFKSAQALFLPVKPHEEIDGFELKLGKHHYLFANNDSPFNNSSSARIAANKYYTNILLKKAGIPVPNSLALHTREYKDGSFKEKIARLKFPLVIKPLRGSLGIDVLCNIQSLNDLTRHLDHYFSLYDYLIVEEFHGGLKSYRVLVFNQQVIGVVLSHPAYVLGDGKHTIQELINLINIKRQELNDAELGPIIVDEECHIKLKELGLSLDYIPTLGEQVTLCYTSNGSRGGIYESLGTRICKENRQLMIRIATILNLTLTGIDVECEDIMQPIESTQGVILEVNYRPSVHIHELPNMGKPVLVTKKMMRSFIYRHPFSYLCSLFSNKSISLYVRGLITLGIVVLLYLFILLNG